MSWWRRWNDSLDAQDTFANHGHVERMRWGKRFASWTLAVTALAMLLIGLPEPTPVLFAAAAAISFVMLVFSRSIVRSEHVMRAGRWAVISVAVIGAIVAALS